MNVKRIRKDKIISDVPTFLYHEVFKQFSFCFVLLKQWQFMMELAGSAHLKLFPDSYTLVLCFSIWHLIIILLC